MNWCERLIKTRQQKLKYLSAKNFISLILRASALITVSSSPFSFAQSTIDDQLYLEHSILVNRHSMETFNSDYRQPDSFSDITNLSGLSTFSLEDAGPYYFVFDSNSCHIDPFLSGDKASDNRKLLATCLKSRLWENENIPRWIRATGVIVLVGAAGSAGKIDDDLKFRIGFDQMDSFLRDWLGNQDK